MALARWERWDPWREMASLRAAINKLFDEAFGLTSEEQTGFVQGWAFPVDIIETPESIILKAELPGLSKEDIKISFDNNQLTIKGER